MNYQYVDIPNLDEISKQILEKIPDFHKDNSAYKSYSKKYFGEIEILKKSVETLKPWNEIFDVAVVSTKQNSKLPIHIDYGPVEKIKYSLNIPVYNCEKTYTVFYKIKEGVQPTKKSAGINDYNGYKASDAEEIDRIYLNKAAFLNTQIPHSAINPTNEPRIILTIRSDRPWKGITHEYN
jgi:hypothetical protein